MGTWFSLFRFSLFSNCDTFIGEAIVLLLVLGSYVATQYPRVWRPRRRGRQVARRADEVPARPADVAATAPVVESRGLLSRFFDRMPSRALAG